MHQIHPDASLVGLMKRMVAAGVKVKLFVNNHNPSETTVLGDLTEYSMGGGYAAVSLDDSDFTASGVAFHIGTIAAPDAVFSVGGGTDSIYGYFITNSSGSALLAVARFSDAPRTLAVGSPVSVAPKLAMSSRFLG